VAAKANGQIVPQSEITRITTLAFAASNASRNLDQMANAGKNVFINLKGRIKSPGRLLDSRNFKSPIAAFRKLTNMGYFPTFISPSEQVAKTA